MSDTALPTLKVPLTTQLLALVINKGTLFRASAGNVGFKGSRVDTVSAQQAAEQAARKAMEHGVRRVDVQVKGPGSGRGQRFVPFKTPALKLPASKT